MFIVSTEPRSFLLLLSVMCRATQTVVLLSVMCRATQTVAEECLLMLRLKWLADQMSITCFSLDRRICQSDTVIQSYDLPVKGYVMGITIDQLVLFDFPHTHAHNVKLRPIT